MNKYKVRVYVATEWSFLTQADHFDEYIVESSESLESFAQSLAHKGFGTDDGRKWIMPGAILSVEKVR